LGNLQVAELLPSIIALLKDEDPAMRWVGVVALGRIASSDERAVIALRESLHDRDEEVHEAAAAALRWIERKATARAECVEPDVTIEMETDGDQSQPC
jgi:HEAT repeat protein